MDSNTIFVQFTKKLTGAAGQFKAELAKIRTGRAHTGMLDGVTVEAYGTPMPLIQLGSIATPEPQLLQITPFDPGNLQAIAAAIRDNQSLGLNPVDDGRVIRIQIPALTEEHRKDLVKIVGTKLEDSMVRMRNARHEALKEAEAAKKDKNLTEDDLNRLQKQIDEAMAKQKAEIDTLAKAKEQEMLTV
jgi:ribosome recycling factor